MTHIIIGGGSGFIGSALTQALRDRGDKVTVLSRTPGEQRITWDSLANGLPDCDAIVNLAGEHILQPAKRWTESYRQEVIASPAQWTILNWMKTARQWGSISLQNLSANGKRPPITLTMIASAMCGSG